MFLLVTTSKALVTSSVALVPTSKDKVHMHANLPEYTCGTLGCYLRIPSNALSF